MTQTNDVTNDLRNLPLTCRERSAFADAKHRGDEVALHVKSLPAGTLVVSTLDGEPGRIVEVCTQNRSRTKATSYVVQTNDGREIWDVSDMFLPTND